MPFSKAFGLQKLPEDDEFDEPYKAWKADPTPAGNATFLKALRPVIEGAARTHVGDTNPLILSRARAMALEGMGSFDPAKGRIKTHLYSHLQGLKRVNRQQTTIVKVPERLQLDRRGLDEATREMADELGREPTDAELSDRTGFSAKRMAGVRRYNRPVAASMMDDPLTGAEYSGAVEGLGAKPDTWTQIVYGDMDPYHQKVMEYSMGLNGRQVLSNNAVAAKLGRSPGAISQAKLRIQKLLDQGQDLDPFGGG